MAKTTAAGSGGGKAKTKTAARARGEHSHDHSEFPLTDVYLALNIHALQRHHLARIVACLQRLSDRQIWWRPNDASNSAGNLALHLAGNVRQWIVAGLGGATDRRQRDLEFSEKGPLPRRLLLDRLRRAVRDAVRVLERLDATALARVYTIQGFEVSGMQAASHVLEHFAFHSGQILYITKQLLGEDLGFTRLPGKQPAPARAKTLPVP